MYGNSARGQLEATEARRFEESALRLHSLSTDEAKSENPNVLYSFFVNKPGLFCQKLTSKFILSHRAGSFTQSITDNYRQPSLLQCLTPFMAFSAWICSFVANFACEFITIDVTLNNYQYFLGFGLWNYQGWSYLVQNGTIYYTRTCFAYSNNVHPDPMWKTAQAFSIISVVIGGLAMCFNCCVICTPNPSKGYQLFSLFYLFTCLSQGLTFLFLKSNACKNNPIYNIGLAVEITSLSAECNLSWGANTGIASTVLWFLTALMMCCIGFKEQKSASDFTPGDEAEGMEEAEKEDSGAVNDPATE